jgi:hypothetical protein
VVEIRVAVADSGSVHGLMRRFVDLFGRSAVSFDGSSREVHVKSDWGSRAVDQVMRAVELWLAEIGGGSATLAIDDVAYTVEAP